MLRQETYYLNLINNSQHLKLKIGRMIDVILKSVIYFFLI